MDSDEVLLNHNDPFLMCAIMRDELKTLAKATSGAIQDSTTLTWIKWTNLYRNKGFNSTNNIGHNSSHEDEQKKGINGMLTAGSLDK